MNLKIKNFGKITNADIKLDGITVICGNNNTGKSTVGKALFSFYNSLYDYKNKIYSQKCSSLRDFVLENVGVYFNETPIKLYNTKTYMSFIKENDGGFTFEKVKGYLENFPITKVTEEGIIPLLKLLNTSDYDILSLSVMRYFTNIMNGQIKNSKSPNSGRCEIKAEFKESQSTLTFLENKCDSNLSEPILHCAYYINSPYTVDALNDRNPFTEYGNSMEYFTIKAILNAQNNINEDSMSNILDSVVNIKNLDDIKVILKKAYCGDIKITNGKYYYSEDGIDFDIRNISAGLKAFVLIERMLETGVLKRKDVLILDEPEIHLHSEWQIIYAELIVILQKTFDLTILLVTHSFQFLESLNFFMKKYEIADRGNYYIPEQTDKGVVMKLCENDALELKKNLTTGSVTLSDLKFKYEMENYGEEDK